MKKYKIPKNTGFIENPFDPRDIFEDEVFVAGELFLPHEYKIENLRFESQGATTYCVSFAVTKMAEYQLRQTQHIVKAYSQPHLFYNSGGTMRGSFFRTNLETAKNRGLISEVRLPIHTKLWTWSKEIYSFYQKEAFSIPFTETDKVPGYARVNPNRDELKRAIIRHGPLMVGMAAEGGYWKDKQKRTKFKDTHAALLVGWDEDDHWWLFDSLQPRANFKGYHRKHESYWFNSAYALVELPDDWRAIRDEARRAPKGNEERYGKERDFLKEVEVASQMVKEFRKFKNQSVFEAAGRFWEVYIRAIVYGGYSLSYRKWGRWTGGDIIADCYYWRRIGHHIFDFDKERKDQVGFPKDSGL